MPHRSEAQGTIRTHSTIQGIQQVGVTHIHPILLQTQSFQAIQSLALLLKEMGRALSTTQKQIVPVMAMLMLARYSWPQLVARHECSTCGAATAELWACLRQSHAEHKQQDVQEGSNHRVIVLLKQASLQHSLMQVT